MAAPTRPPNVGLMRDDKKSPEGRKAEAMNGFTDMRLQVANDRIRDMHAEAAIRRLARRTPTQDSAAASRRSLGSLFGWSLRVLGLAN